MQRSDVRSPFARRSFLSRLGGGLVAAGTALGASASTALAQGTSGGGGRRRAMPRTIGSTRSRASTARFWTRSRLAASARRCTSPRTSSPRARAVMASRATRSRSSSACVMPRRRSRSPTRFGQVRRVTAGRSEDQRDSDEEPYDSPDRRDETFDTLIKLGVHFAVCDKSTQGLAGSLARKTDGKSDAVYKEMLANVIGSSHMVPSGIVAVGHAQEHGYAYAYCG